MPATWPTSIAQLLDQASFQEEFGDTTIRSETDTGPAKVRRRVTKAVDSIRCSIIVDKDQYDDFREFVDVDINGGAGTFNFTNPINQATEEFRFRSQPSVTSLGGLYFSISMTWERMP